jgi:adenylate cyclase
MGFFSELKRRNVIRVGMLYLVGAWLLLQLTDVLSSILPVPAWTGSLVFLLLAIGFVPALVFAWVYELTPEGIKREQDVPREASVTADTARRLNLTIVALLVLAIAGIGLDRWLPRSAPVEAVADVKEAAQTVPADKRTSIAVLPFMDLSPTGDQRYFTDGISEELLNVLVRVDGLRVASRTSSFGFRGTTQSVPAIARELGVGYVLEGSVRKDGYRVRITAQLIEADTDEHLWSANFDRDLKDIFTIQDEIANAIVNSLVDKLGMDKNAKMVNVVPATENLDAYQLYLQARDLFQRRDRLEKSIELYRQAIRMDPGFARAWEGLAAVEAIFLDWLPADDGVDHDAQAMEAAYKATELEPGLSMPFAVIGLKDFTRSKNANYIEARKNFDQAVKNDPKNSTALLWRGIMWRNLGMFNEAARDLELCLEIDPAYYNCMQHLALVYLNKGEEDRALALFETTLTLNFHSVDEAFVPVYVRKGQRLLAVMIATARFPQNSHAPVNEWINAIEDPEGDHGPRLAHFEQWSETTGIDYKWNSFILVAFKHYEMLTVGASTIQEVLWTEDARAYRNSEYFKSYVRDTGILAYWQSLGFPARCQPAGQDDFRCN